MYLNILALSESLVLDHVEYVNMKPDEDHWYGA